MSATTTTKRAPMSAVAKAHVALNMREVFREPIAIIGTTVFPTVALLFFVVPQREVASDPTAATAGAAQLAALAVMSVCLFTFGIGVAEDRARPFDTFLRSLPAGPLPQVLGRLGTGAALSVLGLIPITVIAAVLTEATLEFARIPLTLVAMLIGAMPLLLIGFAVGYIASQKVAIAIVQLLFFGLAFGGGMFLPPELFADWLDTASQALPSRALRDLTVWATGHGEVTTFTFATLVAWGVAMAALTYWAYRRDEGKRFR